jgi:hypothetical protein
LEKIQQKADDAALDDVVYNSRAAGNPYSHLWNADDGIEAPSCDKSAVSAARS